MLDQQQQEVAGGIFRALAREVWIVTVAHGSRRGGLTATWVHAASVDAAFPVALIGLAPNHFTAELVDGQRAFAAHLLRADQAELAWRFAATSGRDGDKLAGLDVTLGETGSPLLTDCLARIECRVYDRKATGDRIYYWGDVTACSRFGVTSPLTDQALFAQLTDAQRSALVDQLQADVRVQRPLQAEWRAGLGRGSGS